MYPSVSYLQQRKRMCKYSCVTTLGQPIVSVTPNTPFREHFFVGARNTREGETNSTAILQVESKVTSRYKTSTRTNERTLGGLTTPTIGHDSPSVDKKVYLKRVFHQNTTKR